MTQARAIFETPRLIVRAWTDRESDVDRIFDIYSRWEVARWLGAVPRAMAGRDEAVSAVSRWAARTDEARGLGLWAVEVRATGVVAGSIALMPMPGEGGEVEVAWHFHPDSWGNGYATEAARGALARGFDHGLAELYAVVRPDNGPSLAVCRRLGMTPLGRTDRWYGQQVEAFRQTAAEHREE